MEKRALGKTGMDVSIIAFGGIAVDKTTASDAADIVSFAIDRGVNYFDSAPSYGDSQYTLGTALKPYRKDVFLACKTGKRTAAEAQAELDESLRAHHTDYFDLYQLHGLDKPEDIETTFAPGGAMETLARAKKEGVVRHLGITCHHDRSVPEILAKYDGFETLLCRVNYGSYLKKEVGVQSLKICAERGMGVIAIKSLVRRALREGEDRIITKNWYYPIYDDPAFARLALNFTLTPPVTTAVTPGDIGMTRLAINLICAQEGKYEPLTDAELECLKAEAAKVENFLFDI
jgi:aryl-alcohol dehydrogenase-like predicted oxidoreductase